MATEKKQKKRRRTPEREESFNRDGHWTRDFFARCEPWPVIEQWATDHNYHLVALRGKRRLYQKGDNPSFYLTFVDIKQRDEGQSLIINSWIHSGFLGKLFHFFSHGSELPIEPTGWTGIWKRREACRDLNSLLERFRQLPIVGSKSLHLADVDPSTLGLFGLLLLPILLLLGYDGSRIEIGQALSNGLLLTLGNNLVPLLGTAVVLFLLHHFLVIRRWPTLLAKSLSLSSSFILFTILSVILMTRTSSEMAAQKLSYHCIYRFDLRACKRALEETPAKDRTQIDDHLSQLQSAIAIMEGRGGNSSVR